MYVMFISCTCNGKRKVLAIFICRIENFFVRCVCGVCTKIIDCVCIYSLYPSMPYKDLELLEMELSL